MKKNRFKELFSKPVQNYPDVAVETLLSVREASKVLGVARPTVERWFRGYTQSGVALESCTVGFRRKTSREAIARFLRRQNESRIPEASRDHDAWDDARTDAVLREVMFDIPEQVVSESGVSQAVSRRYVSKNNPNGENT